MNQNDENCKRTRERGEDKMGREKKTRNDFCKHEVCTIPDKFEIEHENSVLVYGMCHRIK